jgi:cell division protein FtsZ
MGILTVGIVTIPFAFEGPKKIQKAMNGVAELAAQVDAIVVINNEKLRQIYSDFNLLNAFSKSDDVVANAARSIAEIITKPGYINTDFTDVYNTLIGGGASIISVGTASGENRVANAIHQALHSPLINTDVHGATRLLLQIYCSTEHAMIMSEIDQIHDFVREVGEDVEVQWGASLDESLGENERVTIIATGFEVSDIPSLEKKTVAASIDKYYGEGASASSSSAPAASAPADEPAAAIIEEQPAVELELQVNTPQTDALDTDAEEIVIDFDDASADGQGTLFSGIPGWMRGRK